MELPRWDGLTPGGLAQQLRNETTANNTRANSRSTQDPPPHQASTSAISISYGSEYGNNRVLGGDVFALSSGQFYSNNGNYNDETNERYDDCSYENICSTDAALRSGRNPENRFDPIDQNGRNNRRSDSKPPPAPQQQNTSAAPNKLPNPSKIQTLRNNEPKPMEGVQ